jgi:hypothetical protein
MKNSGRQKKLKRAIIQKMSQKKDEYSWYLWYHILERLCCVQHFYYSNKYSAAAWSD